MFYIDGWPIYPILSLMIKTFCDHFVSLKICVILYLPNPLPSYISYWRKKIINKEKSIHLYNSTYFSWNSKLNLSSPVTSQCIVQLQIRMDLSMWKLFIINYRKDANAGWEFRAGVRGWPGPGPGPGWWQWTWWPITGGWLLLRWRPRLGGYSEAIVRLGRGAARLAPGGGDPAAGAQRQYTSGGHTTTNTSDNQW